MRPRASFVLILVAAAQFWSPAVAGPQPPPTNILYGYLATNRTLTLGSPGPVYYVVGDYIVNSPATLTIEPGVRVVFSANRDTLGGGSYPTMSELIVNGSLVADASFGDSIRFVSTENGTGDWGRIYLGVGGSHIVRRATVSGAAGGIDCRGALTISDVLLGNTGSSGTALFANGSTAAARLTLVSSGAGTGAQLEGSGTASDLSISGFNLGMSVGGSMAALRVRVAQCKNGIFAYGSSANTIRECSLVGTGRGSGGTGIRLADAASTAASDSTYPMPTIVTGFTKGASLVSGTATHLLIFDNGYGIVDEPSPYYSYTAAVNYCTVARNDHGITLTGNYNYSMRVYNSIVAMNAMEGVFVYGSSPSVNYVDSWSNGAGNFSVGGSGAGPQCSSYNPFFENPGGNDFHLASGSIFKAWGPWGAEIGAYGPGPGSPVPASNMTWGRLKARYR